MMRSVFSRVGVAWALLTAAGLLTAGCGQTEDKGAQAKDKTLSVKGQAAQVAQAKNADAPGAAEEKHDHSGWWCDEHGVPEAVCGQCNAKYAAECKKKGDWCKEHDRPESQCFICHPELKEKFAAQYRAKYGKEPPPTEDDEKKDEAPKKEGTN
jgi:cobalt-zinc-cadmium efflux system membrane fusion protein